MGNTGYDVVFCSYCMFDTTHAQKVHPIQGTVVQDILRETGQLTVALQASVTTLFQMSYYDALQQFDEAAFAELTLETPFLMPARMKGMRAVGVVLGAHFLLITTISV